MKEIIEKKGGGREINEYVKIKKKRGKGRQKKGKIKIRRCLKCGGFCLSEKYPQD